MTSQTLELVPFPPFKVRGHFENVFREDFGNLRTFRYICRIKVQEAKNFGDYTL